MIDLHMHTTYSDGTDNVIELLKNCEKKGLKLIAITDHDNIEAHLEISNLDTKKYFSGEILLGVEFKSYYKGVAVELLCYNFDLNKVKYFSYLRRRTSERQRGILEEFKRIGKDLGLIFDDSITIDGTNYFASEVFATEILKYKENRSILEKHNISLVAKNKFYRQAQTNPNSIFYIDETKEFPKLEEIVRDVHDAGGVIFLAHPYVYSFEDRVSTAIEIVETYNLDGIECYYSKLDMNEQERLIKYCLDNDKHISGGSDYHGLAHPHVHLGCVSIPSEYIEAWKKD